MTKEFTDCKIIATPGRYDIKPFAFGYQKDSSFAEIFDYHVEKMRQSGVLDTIKTKYDALRQNCPDLRLVVLFSCTSDNNEEDLYMYLESREVF